MGGGGGGPKETVGWGGGPKETVGRGAQRDGVGGGGVAGGGGGWRGWGAQRDGGPKGAKSKPIGMLSFLFISIADGNCMSFDIKQLYLGTSRPIPGQPRQRLHF